MKITINKTQFAAVEAFEDRELLKASGFRWDREDKQWKTPHVIAVRRVKQAKADDLDMTPEALDHYRAEFDRIANTPHCGRCAGTGQFVTMVVNGKPTGPGGICFRCNGSGRQSARDEERNDNYDRYAFLKACQGMMSGESA